MERIRNKFPPERAFSKTEGGSGIEVVLARALGVYKQAWKKRMLLVLAAGPIAGLSGFVFHEDGVPLASLLLGFLVPLKVALLTQVWNQMKLLMVPKFDVDAFLKKYEQ
mmetsp:Transcript_3224/g.7974  ORF Transcript_3224/g.7974 Transcript_3224/m.7974 type:complete len:109 (+) Transcript_3224:382-708(+)